MCPSATTSSLSFSLSLCEWIWRCTWSCVSDGVRVVPLRVVIAAACGRPRGAARELWCGRRSTHITLFLLAVCASWRVRPRGRGRACISPCGYVHTAFHRHRAAALLPCSCTAGLHLPLPLRVRLLPVAGAHTVGSPRYSFSPCSLPRPLNGSHCLAVLFSWQRCCSPSVRHPPLSLPPSLSHADALSLSLSLCVARECPCIAELVR